MFTPAQLLAMTDNEIGMYASGAYGAKLRNKFYASLRRTWGKADAKESIMALRPVHRLARTEA